jgi:hypothetical protein
VTAVIEIPNSAVIRMARGFLTRTDWSFDERETLIRFHEKWCHMHPWIIAALAAWGLEAQTRGVDVRLENANRAAYAWRFGLADYLGVDPGMEVQPHEEAGRFVALRTVANRADLGALMPDVVPLLHLADDPEQARAVHYVLSEMISNVLEHSSSKHGAVVCAQYYTGEHASGRQYVSVGVADTGRGVRASLASNYPAIASDAEAVLKAIQPGITGAVPAGMYGSPDNAGAGLFFTRRLSQSSDAHFAIGSGRAMFRTSTARHRPADNQLVFPIAGYPGTIVSVDFSLERQLSFDDFLAATGRAFGQMDDALREKVETGVRFE